jgi:tetratricopeptide (TPR) repeat protein
MNTKLGRPDRAVALARRAQALSAATWGKASFAVSDALRREAEAEAARHDFTTAIDRLNEATAMLTAPSVLLARAQLEVDRGGYLLRAGRRDEATAGHLALVDSPALAQAGPVTRATVLDLLGESLLRLEAFDAAGKLCEQSVSTVVSLTDQAILSARAHFCLGTAQLRQQHAADALVTADQAHTALWSAMLRQTGVEPPLPLQQLILQLKAHALGDTGRGNEALVVLRESVDLARRIGDAGAEADIWADIAVQQRKMRLYADASISSSNGLAVLGPDGNPLRRANLLENQALIAVALGRPADALPLYPQVLALRRADPDPEYLAVASTEREFAAALSTAGRNQEAVGHADAAIELSRGLGPARRDFLIAALAWRVSLATSLGELQQADASTRELLTLLDPTTTDAAQTRLLLASLMDGQARRAEAEALRAETVAAMTVRFGAASAEVMRTRLAGLSWLRASGRMVEAEATVRDCIASAATTADLMLPCLLAAAETALEAGAFRDAAGHSAHAVSEIETHWEQNGASLLSALNLQARTTAALGDVGGLIRLYDRIHDIASLQGLNPTWIDLEYTQLLIQAGEAKAALPALRRVLEGAGKANDSALVMTATATLAEQIIATGAGEDAIALWTPFASTDAVPTSRVVILQELGAAEFSLARDRDAAASFDQAAILVRSLFGPGNPTYARLIAQSSAALARSGQSTKAEAAIRLLDTDTSRLVALVRTRALMDIAEAADDSVAAIHHARDALEQVRVVSGKASVAEAYARLDLAEELMAWNNHADQNDVEDAIAVIIAQQPGWRAECRVLRIRAMIARQSRRFDSADVMLTAIETLLTAHEGDGSQNLASVRAGRADTRLEAGDAKAADRLFRQAMDMATARTGGHSALWARIAFGAATAAERTGDVRRAEQLRRDATEQLPSSTTRQTYRWL